MKKLLLILGLLMSMAYMGCRVTAQTYTYSPALQTFTNCGSGTTSRMSFSYSSCSVSSGNTTYQLGQVHAAAWARGSSTGSIKFRVEKCSGYFVNGNSGKVFVYDQYNGDVYCTEFSISNSTTSYVDAHVRNYGDFSGSRTFHVYLITSDQVYKFYAGSITVSGPSSNQPPTTPSSPSPSNGATNVSTSPTLSWSSSDPEGGSLSYDFYLGTSSSNLQYHSSGSGTSKSLSGLSSGQTYYWKVIMYDNHNANTHSSIWHFTTKANQPPTTPSNPNPSNGATNVSTSTTLSWSCSDPEGGSLSYDFYLGTSSSNLQYHSSGSGTSKSLSGLNSNQTYYWKVIMYDNQNANTHSSIWHFTTKSASQGPPTPSNPSPSNGASNVSVNPTLSWNCTGSGSTVSYYEVYVRTSDYTYNECFYPNQSSYTIPSSKKLSNNTTYYWRVVAKDNNGQSTQGPLWSFTTKAGNQPPTTPSNPNPADGATGVSTSPTLSWNSTDPEGGSLSYDFYWGTSESGLQLYGSGQGTSRAMTGLVNGQTYYWKVIMYDNQNANTHGPFWHFTVGGGTSGCSWSDCTSGSCGSTQYLTANQKMTAAQYLCQHNILDNGGGSNPLRPDDNITRAELAKIAFYGLYDGSDNVESSLVSDYFPSIYPDLQNSTAYYYQAAKALLYLEYGDGISPFDRDRSVFNPTGNIERCLVLKVLLETFNIAPLSSGTNSFDDYGPSGYTSSKFWGYAQKAYNLGIVQTTHFRPNDYCTRAEAFLFLYRILTNSSITKPTPNNSLSPASSDFFIPTNLSPEVVNAKRGVENGNFCYYEKDFFNIPGYMNLDFGVSYNSYLTEMPDDIYPVKPLGKAWSHTYNMYMNVVTDNYNNKSVYVFHMQDGSLLMYANNNGTLTSLTEGNYYTLSPQTPSASSYTLTSTNQITCTFTRQSVSDGIYYLTQVKDRNNNTITINIGSGVDHYRITSVSTLGRTLNFYYTSGTDLLYYVKDPISRKVYFYYTDNQLTSLKDAKSQYTYFTYGTANTDKDLLTKIKLPEGNYVYNNYQQRKLKSMSRTSATGNTFTDISLSLTYPNGTSSSTVTENLNGSQSVATSYTMNSKDRITRVTSGSHTDLSFQYNISGKPDLISKATDNKASIQASFTYNNKGKVTSLTTTAGGESHTTSITYTSLNDIHTITDANDNTTTYEYTNGNLTSITDALNHTTNITNNSHGFPTKVTNPMGVSTNFTYNSYGNTTAVSIPSLNLSKSVSYDNVSRPINSTDFDNNTTQYSYDNNDNLLSITDALNHTTSFNYDDNDNLIRITNALNRHTDLEYDNNDFMTALSFEGATRSYSYNRDGSLASFTSPNGHTFDYSYNSNGELTSDGYASYSYNSKGQLSSVSKDSKSISYSYDAFGRVSSVSYDGKTVSYTYDNVGNLLTMVYPGNKTVTYTYDAANRMTSVTDWNNHTTTYTYRNDNQLNRVQYPNNVRTTYSYDNSGRRTGMTAARNSGSGTTIASYNFTLDNNGNHTQESITEPFSSYPAIPSQNVNYTYNNANRLMTAGSLSFNYDNNGNTTSKTGRSMTYDIGNMLTGVSGDFSASYTYDGFGNRRSATRNGSTTKYVLNLLAGCPTVLMETSSSGSVQNYYIYGADGLVSRIGADGSTTRYYVFDHRGSTVAMTDATTSANITHKYQYDDFGTVLQSEEADNNLFRYVGKYGLMYEAEDLYFVRARYYDPSIGRFLSEDPIWSTNLYPYADNNPIMRIDPSGKVGVSLAGYQNKRGETSLAGWGTSSTTTTTKAGETSIAGWGTSSTTTSTTVTQSSNSDEDLRDYVNRDNPSYSKNKNMYVDKPTTTSNSPSQTYTIYPTHNENANNVTSTNTNLYSSNGGKPVLGTENLYNNFVAEQPEPARKIVGTTISLGEKYIQGSFESSFNFFNQAGNTTDKGVNSVMTFIFGNVK